MKYILLLIASLFLIKNTSAQIAYVWSGATSQNWNTNTNWTPNGVPSAVDNVTIVAGTNNCVLPSNKTVANLTISSGLLNLNTFTLNTTGVVACNSGTCSNGTFNSTASSLTFAGTLFNANITATVADIYFNGSVFNGSVTVTKTGATNNSMSGNNTFNNTTSLTNSGTGYFLLTNGAVGRVDNFNGNTTINTTNTGAFYVGYGRDANINGNFIINNTSGSAPIYLGINNSIINLGLGATINCGTFTGSALRFYKLIQTGTTAQTLSIGTAGSIDMYASSINGSLTINAGLISVQTSTFSNAVTYNISGTTSNQWSGGGNTYNGVLTVNHSSSGFIGFANGTADTYNADVYANNTSATGGRIIFSNNCNSLFNGNIYVSQSGTTNASGIALGWGGIFPVVTLASGKNIFVNGVFSSGYLQLFKVQATVATSVSLTTTGTSNVQLNNNVFDGTVNITAPDIYAYGGTYNAPTSFVKTGGSSNHNNGNTNIFNSTLNIQNQSNGYFMLSYNSADQFNDNVTISNTGTNGIFFGWFGDSGTPTLASGKTLLIGAGGFSAGSLHLGAFTQLGTSSPLTLTLTGTAMFQVDKNTIPCTFNSSVNITAPNIEIRGGTFNQDAEFTKTGGTSNHNNGNQNIFNGKCTINQQSTGGYFMLGYNSNDLFNGDIVVTNTGTQDIYFGWGSGTGTPIQATGYSITVGGAGFSGGGLIFNTFTKLGNTPVNLNFTGTNTYLRFARNSVFNGNITSVTPRIFFDGCTFNGTVNSTKTGVANDASNGGNIFNAASTFINNGSGYFMFGNGAPDVWNADVTFSNMGNNLMYVAYSSAENLINGNVIFNTSASALGINFCSSATSSATVTAGHSISTGTFDGGYLYLPRFTQLGSAPVNITLNATANYLQYGPSSALGGNVVSFSPGLYLDGCVFGGTTHLTKTGSSGNYGQGGNVFNGISHITNIGSNYLLLGNSSPDVWNDDVTFTNTGSERLLPAWGSVGNMFNGNIYVNTGGSAQGIQFCGGNTTATATLVATKSIITGTLGLNAGYLQLKQFTQLGSAPINLTMTSTANYIQYGPSSNLGGNVTSVSPRLFFNGCTFNGSVDCTKIGLGSDASSGNNIFNGITNITNTGSNYLLLGNGGSDAFNADATFNNFGSSEIYVAYNSANNVFGGVTTFNNAPTTNALIYVSPHSAGTIFNGNIVVTSTNGQGVQFCGGNATASATLVAGKTISVGGEGFSSGTLLLKQFKQLGPTPQTLNLTGSSNLTFGPTSYFGGDLTSVSPSLYFNGCTFDGTTNCTKNGPINNDSNGSNIFNGNATMTSTGGGYLMFGNINADKFNANATFNNLGSNNMHIAFNSLNNTFGGVATFNNAPLTNNYISVSANSAGTIFNDNIIVTSTNGQGVQFCGSNVTASATLVATKTISIGSAGFSSGILLLKQFTQVGTTPQTFTLIGTGNLTFGPTSYFGGDVTSSSPTLFYNGVNFNGLLTAVKTGITNDASVGGNIFNGDAVISNNGNGQFYLGNVNRDQFNGNTIFNNNGGSRFYFAHNHGGQTTTFAGSLTLNSNKSVSDSWSYFACEGTNTSLLVGGDMTANCLGTAQSNFRFLNGAGTTATYNGNVVLKLNNSHSSTQFQMGVQGLSYYNGNITVENTLGGTGSAILFNQGALASSTLAATKTIALGAGGFVSGDLSLIRFTQLSATPQTMLQTTGNTRVFLGPTSRFDGDVNFNFPQVYLNGTIYNGMATIQKNGALDNAGNGGNVFNGTTVITNSGSGYLLTGNGTADLFNGSTTFNNTGSHSIYFAHNHANQTTVFAQPTILNSVKTGAISTLSYLIAENTNSHVQFDKLTVNIGGTFRSDYRILLGTGSTALYGGDFEMNISNTNVSTTVTQGYNGKSVYNGNISLTNSGGASGINFNQFSVASSTLMATKSISVGVAGYSSGILALRNFTQFGSAPNTLPLTGPSNLTFGPNSLFGGDVTSTSGTLLFNTTTFNSVVNSTKNGTTNDASVGGNVFNGTTTLTANGTGALQMANTMSDAYNGNITFVQSNTGIMYPNHNTNCTYAGNVTVSSPSTYTITFGQAAGGIATFNGSNAQTINKNGTVGNPRFTRMIVNKTADSIKLNTRTDIVNYLTLTQGIINTTQTNILNMNNASTTNLGNITSFINGPMNYDKATSGATILNFPVGKVGIIPFETVITPNWRPVILTVNHNNGTSYTYNTELFNQSAEFLVWAMPPTVTNVSRIHWWDIERKNTTTGVVTPTLNLTGNQTITLFYDWNDGVTNPANLTIVKNSHTATTAWRDIGGTGSAITTGSITSTSAPSAFNSFSRFTLGNRVGGINPLPIELLSFIAKPNNSQVYVEWVTASEKNNSYFEVERGNDGVQFDFLAKINAYGTGNSSIKQTYALVDERPFSGISYYRLKQVDFNGDFTYSNPVGVEFVSKSGISLYPNPANNEITILGNYQSNATIKIINSLGAVVKVIERKEDVNNKTLNVADLTNGIYYLEINTNTKSETIKFSIVK